MRSFIQVVAAVSAIVSAFHGGYELINRIKGRRKGKRKAAQASKEENLQESLQEGESTVRKRFDDGCQQLGVPFMTGDDIARERLYHIAVVMQAEIIRSLQLAAEFQNIMVNLTVLRDASVLNRQDTLNTLGELRQRILESLPVERPFAVSLQLPRMRRAPSPESIQMRREPLMESIRTFMTAQIAPDYIPPAITITAAPDTRSESGITRFLSSRRAATSRNALPNAPTQLYFASTFEHLRSIFQQQEPSFEEPVFRQLGRLQIENEPQGWAGAPWNASISTGSAESNLSYSGASVSSVETLSTPSLRSSSTPSTSGISTATSPDGLPPGLPVSVQLQRPTYSRPPPLTQSISWSQPNQSHQPRPCKKNNYWGFCKGAWATRVSPNEGLTIKNRLEGYSARAPPFDFAMEKKPERYYGQSSFLKCRYCEFHSASYKRTLRSVDPTVQTSPCGIRYRWIFLAKSHIKASRASQAASPNYGCMICCAEGRDTIVFGNPETLMNHIYLEHRRQMSADMQSRMKIVFNRWADEKDDWDLNILLALKMVADEENIGSSWLSQADMDLMLAACRDHPSRTTSSHTASMHAGRLLGWLACAKRPLKWSEIQAAWAINPDDPTADFEDRKLLVGPKDLCGHLVTVNSDGVVGLSHSIVKE
ncbi:hypothetical protein W97_03885 [Coniosporium apollinis CBS 100218]|uniref:GPI inositol-deacylase winged helix domain-containing protein n=1 Tax=Coniosporium apollinis (strain CBS 100218) TaxID=1168221 RepID=R7YRW2_CONA1|nr:uncharacterized protein W97_03885 [Coniosporium apollinis CBS 100218]EON64652.1 hypothetical protein W97_03885 [Coniosporium apollinis CBS 100218]